MKLPILALTHACDGKVVVCSLFRSHRPFINIHDAYGLYDRLITAMRAVEMRENVRTESNKKYSIPQVLLLELCQ